MAEPIEVSTKEQFYEYFHTGDLVTMACAPGKLWVVPPDLFGFIEVSPEEVGETAEVLNG